jgi:glycosyltransferase involved in cell wall biosynthesis
MTKNSNENGPDPVRVSVIIRTKDRLAQLREALNSVVSQSFTDIEVVVVNDGGEGVEPVVSEFRDQPFPLQLLEYPVCKGRSAAANHGLEAARGDYLTFLDDDDLLLPDHLRTLVKALDENQTVGAVYADVEAVDSQGERLHLYCEEFNEVVLLGASYLPIHSVMFRHIYVDGGLRFNEDLEVYEDWDFWVRLAELTPFEHIPVLGAIYRDQGDSKVGHVSSEIGEINKHREILYETWLKRWDGKRLIQIFDGLLQLQTKHAQDKISLSETIGMLNSYLAERAALVAQQQAQITHHQDTIERQELNLQLKEQAIQDSYQFVRHLNRQVIERSTELNAMKNHIEYQKFLLSRREDELAVLYQSTSWRITGLLRFVVRGISRLVAWLKPSAQGSSEKAKVWPLFYYLPWLEAHGLAKGMSQDQAKACLAKLSIKPTISIVMPVYNPQLDYLQAAIDSVLAQTYPHWEFCIADDHSSDPEVKRLLEQAALSDERIKLVLREENGHISRATNSAIALAHGDYVALLDHDDCLHPDALLWVVREIEQYPEANVIYSDEDKISEEGERIQPYFKGDWNYDLLLSHNMISHLGVYRRSLLDEIGGFRVGVEGSQDYDVALRCIEKSQPEQIRHIPRILYHWRSYEGSTALSGSEKSYALDAAGVAIKEHLERIGRGEAEVIPSRRLGTHRVRYPMPQEVPRVSLVLVVDSADMLSLQRSLLSILERTEYSGIEEILLTYCEEQKERVESATVGFLGARWPVRHVRVESGWGAMINAAIDQAKGDVIGILSTSIEVKDSGWLDEMVRHALRTDVGVVGARIFYHDNTVQHAGLILKPEDFPGFPFQGPQGEHPGYFGRAQLLQNFSVLSPACLVFQKERFSEVGGMDASHYTTLMAAIDFCLKLRGLSYWHTWTPYAELTILREACYPFDPADQQQQRDLEYLKQTWKAWFDADPVYNPNLSFHSLYTALASKSRLTPC